MWELGREYHITGLAAKGLDTLGLAMLAIVDESVDVCIADPGVLALLVGASEAFEVYALGCSSAPFHLKQCKHYPLQYDRASLLTAYRKTVSN